MEHDRIKALLQKYAEGTCTEKEKALLESWYLSQNLTFSLSANELEEDLKAIGKDLPLFKPVRKISIFPRIAAAAILLSMLSAGLFFYSQHPAENPGQHILAIIPGGNKAILILGNGKRISLTDATNGNIASQSDVSIVKTAGGQVIYTVNPTQKSDEKPTYNTIETPKGGQFQVILPDGTKVWLNAASSLLYPTYFSGKQRRVELKGEGYFEVAKNKAMPFFVKTKNQEIEVLGTHFNVNAYADEEASKTTLIEGRVKIKTASAFVLLKPGEQAVLTGDRLNTGAVDTDIALAWKNGQFMFNDENIQSIMRQIARWYNVEVVYAGKPLESKVFWGSISRFQNVSEVLDILELTKSVKFKIEGRRIIVMR